MSAEIPQNRTVVETSLSPKTDTLGSLSVGSVAQHHEENQSIRQLPPMSESDHSFPSKSVSQEAFEEQRMSEMGRATCQPAQHIMSQRSPQEVSLFWYLHLYSFVLFINELVDMINAECGL